MIKRECRRFTLPIDKPEIAAEEKEINEELERMTNGRWWERASYAACSAKRYYRSVMGILWRTPQYTETVEEFLQRINGLGEFVQGEYKDGALCAALYKTDAIEEPQELKAAKELLKQHGYSITEGATKATIKNRREKGK